MNMMDDMIQMLLAMVINENTGRDKPLEHSLIRNNESINTVDYTTGIQSNDIRWIRVVVD